MQRYPVSSCVMVNLPHLLMENSKFIAEASQYEEMHIDGVSARVHVSYASDLEGSPALELS